MIDDSAVFAVHGLLGNQVGIRASKIVTVTQGVHDEYTRIFVDGDPEPITTQESWSEVMNLWTKSEGKEWFDDDRTEAVLGAVDDTNSEEE